MLLSLLLSLSCDMWHMRPDTWQGTKETWPDMLHLTFDTWHMTHDIWNLTHDTWQMTCDIRHYDTWRMNWCFSGQKLKKGTLFGIISILVLLTHVTKNAVKNAIFETLLRFKLAFFLAGQFLGMSNHKLSNLSFFIFFWSRIFCVNHRCGFCINNKI